VNPATQRCENVQGVCHGKHYSNEGEVWLRWSQREHLEVEMSIATKLARLMALANSLSWSYRQSNPLEKTR